jgi:hypothetical protein
MFLTKEACTAGKYSVSHTFYLSVSVLSEEQRMIEKRRERERVGMVIFVSQTTHRHLSLPFKRYTTGRWIDRWMDRTRSGTTSSVDRTYRQTRTQFCPRRHYPYIYI